jgi:hypothetical protein
VEIFTGSNMQKTLIDRAHFLILKISRMYFCCVNTGKETERIVIPKKREYRTNHTKK